MLPNSLTSCSGSVIGNLLGKGSGYVRTWEQERVAALILGRSTHISFHNYRSCMKEDKLTFVNPLKFSKA